MMTVYEIIAEAQRGAIQAYLPGTRSEIAAGTGLPRSQVEYRIRLMHKAGECHIGGYKRSLRTGGKFSPIYHDGHGIDVKCKLKPHTDKIYSRRWRKVHDKDEVMEKKRAKDRMRNWPLKGAGAAVDLANIISRRAP